MKRRLTLLALAAFAALGCEPTAAKKPNWAKPIPGRQIDNFHHVSPGLYRGAHPSDAGFHQLKAMGIRTVVNLRRMHGSRETVEDLGMKYVEIPCKAWSDELEDQAVRFLKVMMDTENLPVFIHCKFGGDRTGAMVAVYRMAVCGWSRREALEEMTDSQFEFHRIWEDLVRFVEAADVEALKRRARQVEVAGQAAG
ncbi:MAG: fused DSP-PTPase phosphatase/NAD kinase-like protein [Planctomycetota bacterium]